MPDRLDHAHGLLLKGDSDLLTARTMLSGDGPYDTACFHAQQAAEKYLKALLAFAGQPIPRTHNLEDLFEECRRALPNWSPSALDRASLTPYAVELRYDFEFWPDRATGVAALTIVEQLRAAVVGELPRSGDA